MAVSWLFFQTYCQAVGVHNLSSSFSRFSVNTCKMSETNVGSKDLNLVDNDQKVEVNNDSSSQEIPKDLEKAEDNPMPTQAQEEAVIKKKYGGLLPRKTPLISKDHDRAFFDSADWALGKGSQKSKGPLEALRPKLQPTPHQQVRSRRSSYAPADIIPSVV
uniref:Endosulphine n=2 Tax=Lactuca sativa TaxID=4236 RepID=A0A9R1XIS9_LACSA|nr:hypothetical protein LSAT_V11C400169580 [Lactuca sativa]